MARMTQNQAEQNVGFVAQAWVIVIDTTDAPYVCFSHVLFGSGPKRKVRDRVRNERNERSVE